MIRTLGSELLGTWGTYTSAQTFFQIKACEKSVKEDLPPWYRLLPLTVYLRFE